MLFQRRVDRAFDYMKKQTGKDSPPSAEEYDPKSETEKPELSDVMEKGDLPAMILSALLIIVPLCLVVLLAIVGISRLVLRV